jgi:hypothetical protein
MKPQNAAVLELLRHQGDAGVTPALALTEVGSMRLAARVAEIADELDWRYEIVNLGWTTPTGKHVARYVLRRREPDTVTLWGDPA